MAKRIDKIDNSIKPNFEKWLMENEDSIEPINDIINLLAPIRDYLPNIESFIIWLCEIEDGVNESGFFEKHYLVISHLEIEDYYNSTEIQN